MIFTRVEQVRDEILFLSSSVAECLPGMHETLSSIPSTEKRREDGEVSISQLSAIMHSLKQPLFSLGK